MKSLLKKVLTCIMAIIIVCGLVACQRHLNGTYTSTGLIKQSFTFKTNNEVTFSAFGINANGTYKIEKDKITITYSLLGISYDLTKDFSKKGASIFIDGTEYVKD